MSTEFEYYRIRWKNDNTIPQLEEDNECPKYLYIPGPIENPELMLFKLGDPIPLNPNMADYLTSPAPVVSRKIHDVLEPLNISGLQLLQAEVVGKNDEVFDEYWAIHVFNIIKCLDLELSKCEVGSVQLDNVEKIVLDTKVLSKIPLEKRLVFCLREDTAYQMFHVSIVKAIMSTNPSGVRFIKVEDLNEATMFSD